MLSGKSAWQFNREGFRSGFARRMSVEPVRVGITGLTTTSCQNTVSAIREDTGSISGRTLTDHTVSSIDVIRIPREFGFIRVSLMLFSC